MDPGGVLFREVQRFQQWWLKLLFLPLLLALPLLFYGHLDTEVRNGVIAVRFWPFHFQSRQYSVAELRSFQRRTYDPLREFGGWGVRAGRHGGALNVHGNDGVELTLPDGHRLMIGSQRAGELEDALHAAAAGAGAFHERQFLWQGTGAFFVALGAVPILGVLVLFFFMRMITEVRSDGLYVRFVPFHLSFRRFGWEELESFEARTYRPIREYGGWGLRGFGRNRALNVSGNKGLQLVFKDGRRILVGSQRADDLASVSRSASGR